MSILYDFRPAPFAHLLRLREIDGHTPEDARTPEIAVNNAEIAIRQLLREDAAADDRRQHLNDERDQK